MAAAIGGQAQRLPGGVRPEHYTLVIVPDLQKARFEGTERIDVVLDAPTTTITLNAAEIEFGSVKALGTRLATGTTQSATGNGKLAADQTATVTLDAAKQQATFTFPQPLPAGQATLQITYSGILNDKLRGFYLSKTKLRNYGVTQFEATDARRAFPCFDEPALKATFNVTLVIDSGDTAISNTRIVRDLPGPLPGKHTVEFDTTPKMSTYLVAWLVGDFQCSDGKQDGVPIRACATPDKVKLTKFALDAAKWDLKYYDRYFGIKYPMAKLDLVAIPDFEAGAMENFGCLTFREIEMLVDQKGPLPAKKDVAETIAHEMAHQWFGDLVTPAWWDNLWLNEGFATWMETKAAAQWQPKWHYDQDVAQDLNHTLDEDAGPTTRPIRAKAETPEEINALFDDIAYGKAGAVIGMVEHWVGEDTFRRGVQAYLSAHLYGNATADDFWDAQTRTSGLPVDKVMRSFIEQPGVPEISLAKQPAGNNVTQSRFNMGGDAGATDEAWTIPVCFTGAPCKLLAPSGPPLDAPVTFANAGDKGYYRTAYPKPEFAALSASAETALTPPERIGLLGDRWALMRAGQASVGDFLDLVLALKADPSADVADSALGRVGVIENQIATDADRERLDAVVRREFGPVYAALGGPKHHEDFDHAELRQTLFEALGQAKDPGVLAEAADLMQQLFAGKKPSDPTLGDAAVVLSARTGSPEMYDRLMRATHTASDPDFREAALHVLTRFQAPDLVQKTLEYALSDDVRSQDAWTLLALLLERRETQDQAWKFITTHWAEIEKKSTESSGVRIVEAAGSFCTVERRQEVASFFKEHKVESSERAVAKSLESIDGCVALRQTQGPQLRNWLDTHPAR